MSSRRMHRIYVSTLLTITSIFLFAGCSSSDVMTIKDLENIDKKDVPDDIWVTTKDSTEYHFIKPDYYVEDDTLFGERRYILNDEERVLVRKITHSDIESIQTEKGGVGSNLVIIGVALAIFIGGMIVIL